MAVGDVEVERAARIGGIGRAHRAQLQPQPVLREQHAVGAVPCVGLVALHPPHLGCGEAGQHPVAGARQYLGRADARVEFEVYPHGGCPAIAAHYQNLIGLSIARGFTHKVRELFGGPRGCTHTTALLQAMAPVAIQSVWSMRAMNVAKGTAQAEPEPTTREERLARMRFNLNTCHIWDENGEQAQIVADGGDIGFPIWITDRYAKLGRDPMEWRTGMGGG